MPNSLDLGVISATVSLAVSALEENAKVVTETLAGLSDHFDALKQLDAEVGAALGSTFADLRISLSSARGEVETLTASYQKLAEAMQTAGRESAVIPAPADVTTPALPSGPGASEFTQPPVTNEPVVNEPPVVSSEPAPQHETTGGGGGGSEPTIIEPPVAREPLPAGGEPAGEVGGLKGFLGEVAGIGAAVGAVQMAAGAFDFLKEQITETGKAGMEANVTEAQTVAVLKSTHDASGMTAESVASLADHLMSLTGISADSIQAGENMLMTFTNIGKKTFPDATSAVLDMATAMNHGMTPSAQQLSLTAIQIGKALNDPIKGVTALQRVGVKMTDTEKQQIATMMAHNDIAGAQAVILRELNTEFGGQAAAAGQANGGIKILQATMETTREKIGQAFIPVLNSLLGAFEPIVQAAGEAIPAALQFLSDHADQIKVALAGFGAVVAAVVVPALLALLAPLAATVGTIIAGAAPVVAIGLAVAGLALAFKNAYDTNKPFHDAVVNLIEQVKGLAGIIVGNLQDAFQRVLPYLKEAASWVGEHLGAAFQAILPHITDFVNWLSKAADVIAVNVEPVVQTATTLLIHLFQWIGSDAVPAIQHLASWLGDHLGPILGAVAGWVGGTLLPALQKLGGWIVGTAIPALASFASWLGEHLGPIIGQIAQWVQTTLLPALQKLGAWIVGTALPAIASFASWLGDHLGPIVQQLGNWFATSLLPVIERFGTFLVQQVIPAVIGVAQHIGQFADDVITRIVPIIKNLAGIVGFFANILWTVLKPIAIAVFGAVILALNVLKGIWDAVWPGLQQTLFGVWEMIKGIIEIGWSIISGIIKIGLDILGGQWGKAWDDIKAMLGGVWDGITKVLGGAWDTIKGIFTSQIDLLKGIAGKIWDGIKSVFAAGINATLDLLAGFVNGFADAVDGIAHALGVKGNPIPEWHPAHVNFGSSSGGGGSPSGGSAAGGGSAHGRHAAYARGTDFHPGGVALVGEEGPELVGLPRGASVLPAGATAEVLSGWGVPGYAGGVGDFFGGLADKVKSALGDVAGLVSDAPGALLDKALSAAGLNLSSLSGALGQMGGGLLTTLKTEVLPAITKWLASLISTSDSGGGPVSASYGNAPGLLPGFPLMNQLAQKDINDQNDCVPTSLASGVSYLLHHLVSPVGLKDEVYGASYMGGQSPARYIPAVQKLGVEMQRVTGGASQLIATIISNLKMGHPVLASIPSNWNVISHGGSTHEVDFAGYDAQKGLLTAMNPWRGFFQTAPTSWWEPRLQYGEVDPLIRMARGGVLREMVMGRGVSSGRGYLLGERGPETVTPGDASALGGGDTHLHLTVQVTASALDGSPAQAGQTFGREFASELSRVMTQRGH